MKILRIVGKIAGKTLQTVCIAITTVTIGIAALAYANYLATQGTGTPFASVVIGGTHYMGMLLCDLTNGETQCAAVNSSGQIAIQAPPTLPLPSTAATSTLQITGNTTLSSIQSALASPFQAGGSIGNTSFGAANSPIVTNPTATLTLDATTTAYTAGQLIANSGTAGSVVNPSFAIANSAGGAVIGRLRLSTNDTTSTAWGAQTVQVDLWTTTPTWTNGDRGTWSPATGTGAHLGAYTCVFSAEYGDGAYAECYPQVNNSSVVKLASGTSVFWSLQAVTGSGVTGATKVFTLTAELQN